MIGLNNSRFVGNKPPTPNEIREIISFRGDSSDTNSEDEFDQPKIRNAWLCDMDEVAIENEVNIEPSSLNISDSEFDQLLENFVYEEVGGDAVQESNRATRGNKYQYINNSVNNEAHISVEPMTNKSINVKNKHEQNQKIKTQEM